MAVGLRYVVLLHLTLLDTPGFASKPTALCPHTLFYHDCWIRRFPGLSLGLPASEQRGARVLRRKSQLSASLCGRMCCDQASCNMAVFYADTRDGQDNCHLVHCPQPGSCILQLQEKAVLFTVTAGVDPDLLVFNQQGQVDFNPRSSLKWDRPNDSHALASSSAQPPALITSVVPASKQASSTHNPPPQPLSPPHSSPQHSPPHPGDSPLRSFPPTHSPPFTAPLLSENPFISPSGTLPPSGDSISNQPTSSWPPLGQPRPNLQSPAHLDSSKQHLNETKTHGGRNQSSDGELEDAKDPLVNLWLLPGLLGSSVALLCCCSGILALGCCRRRKRGRYRPGHARDTRRGTLLRCTILKEAD
ncbi:MANSC domain-containing protein 4 [Pelodytes ibericus]